MMGHRNLAAITAAALLALGAMLGGCTTATSGRPPLSGPVVLTVAGAVQNPNRGPVDPFADGFFVHHEIAFDRATEFDLAALEALGMHEVSAQYPNWPARSTFEGPLLADVLAAAGAAGRTVRTLALDGYAAEIPASDLRTYPIVLAVKRDGRYLGLGGRGPLWVIYPRDDFPALQQAKDDASLAWAVFAILVD